MFQPLKTATRSYSGTTKRNCPPYPQQVAARAFSAAESIPCSSGADAGHVSPGQGGPDRCRAHDGTTTAAARTQVRMTRIFIRVRRVLDRLEPHRPPGVFGASAGSK